MPDPTSVRPGDLTHVAAILAYDHLARPGDAERVAELRRTRPWTSCCVGEGWRAAGMLHGLDEGDPEVFYYAPDTSASA
jgi:hypothetical protein